MLRNWRRPRKTTVASKPGLHTHFAKVRRLFLERLHTIYEITKVCLLTCAKLDSVQRLKISTVRISKLQIEFLHVRFNFKLLCRRSRDICSCSCPNSCYTNAELQINCQS